MDLKLRKFAKFVDKTFIEGGKVANEPVLLVAVAAVIKNPWSEKGFVEDLNPSILDLANNEIANFTWAMRYTVPFLKQIKGLKNNQNYKIIEETEITNKGEIENDNHNENFIDPINFDGKTLTMIDDIFLFPPELIIGLSVFVISSSSSIDKRNNVFLILIKFILSSSL